MITIKEADIINNWVGNIEQPIISITCATYNHQDYISNTLDGFMMQKTKYPFEIIIGDDCSSDDTMKIIQKYKEHYPNIIKVISWSENVGAMKNWITLLKHCKGKYIAHCDGDDYWDDDTKLQIQADYLEEHTDIAITGHDAIVINESGEVISNSKLPDKYKYDMSSEELKVIKRSVLSLTMMYRNIDIYDIPELKMVISGDTFLVSMMGQYGGSHYHTDIKPAKYRVHKQGVWARNTESEKNEILVLSWYWLYRYYKRIGDYDTSVMLKNRYITTIFKMFSTKKLIKEVIKRIRNNKI